MADESWFPGKHLGTAWEGTKAWAKKHPALTGALVAGGTVAAVVGTGPVGLVVAITAASAGSGIAKNIASDPGEKKEEKK